MFLSILIEILFTISISKWIISACLAFLFAHMLIQSLKEWNRRNGGAILKGKIFEWNWLAREEERIFLFVDLEASTELADKIGHVKYSAFLQDCYRDIGWCVHETNASIYQIIGDEIVLTWKCSKQENFVRAIDFYFLFAEKLHQYDNYFSNIYDKLPLFKASIHCGKIMRLEQGRFKSILAYHGDVVNTAARIQKLCKNYAYPILITRDFYELVHSNAKNYKIDYIDKVKIQGKEKPVELYGVNNTSQNQVDSNATEFKKNKIKASHII